MKSNIFSLFSCSNGIVKPYKIQGINNDARFGLTADSLNNLRKKAAKKLKIPERSAKLVLAEDGTEIDEEDYFSLLQPQTLFVILGPGESWQPEESHDPNKLRTVLKTLLDASADQREIIKELHSLMEEESSPAMLELMGKVTTTMEMNIAASDRSEDPKWFHGVEPRFKTKEDVMRDRARSRVRSYLYTAKDHVKDHKLGGETESLLRMLIEQYESQLRKQDYFSAYFDRTTADKNTFCDTDGWLHCEGLFNEDNCSKPDHFINPYGSAEARVLFSTWNLDHRIEKSREVLPCLVKALQGLPASRQKLNHQYFFDLLFTRHNLKLVHVTCHDKRGHADARCDTNKYYVK